MKRFHRVLPNPGFLKIFLENFIESHGISFPDNGEMYKYPRNREKSLVFSYVVGNCWEVCNRKQRTYNFP